MPLDLHRRARRRLRGHRRRERAGIRPEDLRLAERLVERAADDLRRRIGQQMKLRVGPDDPQIRVDHRDAVRDRVEDLLGLNHHPDPAHGRELRSVDVDRVELLIAQQRKRLRDRADRHALERLGQASRAIDFPCELSRSMTNSRGFSATPVTPSLDVARSARSRADRGKLRVLKP